MKEDAFTLTVNECLSALTSYNDMFHYARPAHEVHMAYGAAKFAADLLTKLGYPVEVYPDGEFTIRFEKEVR